MNARREQLALVRLRPGQDLTNADSRTTECHRLGAPVTPPKGAKARNHLRAGKENIQMEQISTHLDPAWRGKSDFIIHAELPEAGRFEQVWARRIGENYFEICCIPFFLYDMSLGDRVLTRKSERWNYLVDRVTVASGRYVFRAFFDQANQKSRAKVIEDLRGIGALSETASSSLISIDAVDEEHAQQVASFLLEQEQQGRLVLETGRS